MRKHIPIRMCIVTKERKPLNELIRLVKTKDNKVKIDIDRSLSGRGANISQSIEIFNKALEKNILERALKLNRKLTLSEKEDLKQEFERVLEEINFRKGKKIVKIKISKKDFDEALSSNG